MKPDPLTDERERAWIDQAAREVLRDVWRRPAGLHELSPAERRVLEARELPEGMRPKRYAGIVSALYVKGLWR